MSATGTRRTGPSTLVTLGAIVTLALAVRLWGIDFALPHVLARPDELFLLGIVMTRLHAGDPNPHMFDYPSLYLYVVAGLFAMYHAWGRLTGRFADAGAFVATFRTAWEPFFLLVRTVNAVVGAATAALCYGIAAPLFGPVAGLSAALFMALAFLHVRDSHYATTDIPMAFFIMCTMLALVRLHLRRDASHARLAGIFGGLAVGTKYNAVLLAAPMLAVEILHAWKHRDDWRRALRETYIFRLALIPAAIFVATSPYLLLDYQTALQHLKELQASTSGGMTPAEMLGRGWTYHLPVSLRYGLGIPLLGAALGGLAWMTVRMPAAALILGSFPVTYYVVAGAGHNVFVRYMIPVVPFLCVFAGYAVAVTAAALNGKLPRVSQPVLATALAALVVAPSAMSVARFDWLLAQEDSRLVAARWIHEQIPAGSSIYTSGNIYGHPQLEPPDRKYRLLNYDRRAGAFTIRERIDNRPTERPAGTMPDVIIVQKSALPFSHIPEQVAALVTAEYELRHVVRAADLAEPGNVYDIQDGFYAPFAGFRGVRRPGPNLEIYMRRQ